MLLKLDAFLLRQMQKFCDKLQALAGLTKYFVLKWLTIFTGMSLWLVAIAQLIGTAPIAWVYIGLAVVYSILAATFIRHVEREERLFLEKGKILYNGYHERSARLLFAGAWVFLGSWVALDGILFTVLCQVAWIYTAGCVPRPPGKSEVRQWYERALTWLGDVLGPAPEPIPITGR